jgi:hypothetical protein
MGGVAVETLEKVLGCTLDEALATYSGRGGLGSEWVVSPKTAPQHDVQSGRQDAI